MPTEEESNEITGQRLKEVFSDVVLIRQQHNALTRMLERAMKRFAPEPVPKAEIEGIKEMILVHLWPDELVQQLPTSEPSPMTNSETLG